MANFALSSTSVRSLKHALQDRFPTVKSSHLSEAIAVAAGFRTHAALRAFTESTTAVPIVFLQEKLFVQRLHTLGYPGIKSFSFSTVWLGSNAVPEEFQSMIARLLKLEERPDGLYPAIYALRRQCAALFAKTFGIGHLESAADDKRLVKRLGLGIDHKACKPDWGDVVNARHSSIDFPGTDHQVRFYERLPLSNGKYIEYSTALVSMPYKGSFRIPELPAAQTLAERVGWQYAELEDWSWYSAQATTLVLFRRTTTHEDMLRMWSTSFKRWLIENKSRLLKGASVDRRNVISDAVDCPHMPLDVDTWESFRERYLREFAYRLYANESDSMTKALKKVFERWCAEQVEVVA